MPPPPAVVLHPVAAVNSVSLILCRGDSGMGARSSSRCRCRCGRRLRYAVLGAGFAGLSVAWHLLQHRTNERQICLDIYDENGIGHSASGNSGGLLHPYSPKAKLLWYGAEFWKESLELLQVAQRTLVTSGSIDMQIACTSSIDEDIVLRSGIVRTAMSEKNVENFTENARNCYRSCPLDIIDGDAAQCLIPGLSVPFNLAVHMPQAMCINPKKYLKALFIACQNLVSKLPSADQVINLIREPVNDLSLLGAEYDDVIICLGAKVSLLPELAGKLPLRQCRGVIVELELPADDLEEYPVQSPSILSDAWLAFEGPCHVSIGSTWDWKSSNYSSAVSDKEFPSAVRELLLKAKAVYPKIGRWSIVGARAGLRAMPPLNQCGSLPLLGSVNNIISGGSRGCTYWLVGGLGSRGLLYHGLVGKLTAQAVVSRDENVIPSEFTMWKSKISSCAAAIASSPF